MDKLRTKDDYFVEIHIYNRKDYSGNVFIAKKPNEEINSSNCKIYRIKGRDKYECLIKEGDKMTTHEITHMFF